MPYNEAERNMRLFAAEVMPELKKRVPLEQQLIARAGASRVGKEETFLLPA